VSHSTTQATGQAQPHGRQIKAISVMPSSVSTSCSSMLLPALRADLLVEQHPIRTRDRVQAGRERGERFRAGRRAVFGLAARRRAVRLRHVTVSLFSLITG
jgi:hypothetical protein